MDIVSEEGRVDIDLALKVSQKEHDDAVLPGEEVVVQDAGLARWRFFLGASSGRLDLQCMNGTASYNFVPASAAVVLCCLRRDLTVESLCRKERNPAECQGCEMCISRLLAHRPGS